MKLAWKSYGSAHVVDMPEQMNLHNASTIANAIAESIDERRTNIILNMSTTEFADSSGLSVLIKIYNNARVKGARVVMVSPASNILSLLTLTKLNTLFEVFDDNASAITALGKM